MTTMTTDKATLYNQVRLLVQSGDERSLDKAAEILTQLAEEGHTDARVDLGFLLASRGGASADLAGAARWFRSAAESGSAVAQFNLGALYQAGRGVQADLAEAARWFRAAAEQGHAEAAYNYALLCRKLEWDGTEIVDAVGFLSKIGDETGDAGANFAVALALTQGWHQTVDLPAAADRYRKAADAGHASAAYNLGLIHFYGEGGVPCDKVEAKRLLQKAAELGHERAREALQDPQMEAIEEV